MIHKAKMREIKKQTKYAHIDEIKYSMNLHEEDANQNEEALLIQNAMGIIKKG